MVEIMPPVADSHFLGVSGVYLRPTRKSLSFGIGWASSFNFSGSVMKKPVSFMPSGSSSFSLSTPSKDFPDTISMIRPSTSEEWPYCQSAPG